MAAERGYLFIDCIQTAETKEKLKEYRKKYKKVESVEEQFLRKVEILLTLLELKEFPAKEHVIGPEMADKLLEMGQEAVRCTVPDYTGKMDEKLWLSPAELETVLVLAAVDAVCGRMEEAYSQWHAVWHYPWIHQWEDRMAALILPQAALLGMTLEMVSKNDRSAFEIGKEALELLRRNYSQCYLLPLLDCLCRLSGQTKEEKEYLVLAAQFRKCFRKLYETAGISGYRLWQSISVDNTRDVGMVLQMLRKFQGKSYEKAVYDGKEQIVTPRHLMRIESGSHKPSREVYERLLK